MAHCPHICQFECQYSNVLGLKLHSLPNHPLILSTWVVSNLELLYGVHLSKCLHGFVGFLFLFKSAHWTYIPEDGMTRPEDDKFCCYCCFTKSY